LVAVLVFAQSFSSGGFPFPLWRVHLMTRLGREQIIGSNKKAPGGAF
jgi:hypothetical protein